MKADVAIRPHHALARASWLVSRRHGARSFLARVEQERRSGGGVDTIERNAKGASLRRDEPAHGGAPIEPARRRLDTNLRPI